MQIDAGRTDWNYQIADLARAVSEAVNGTSVDINPPDKRSYIIDFARHGELAANHLPQAPLYQSIDEFESGSRTRGFQEPS